MPSPLTVMVINDDGPDAPTFIPFLNALRRRAWVQELRVVIPQTNRSWIGTAVTRSGTVQVKSEVIADLEALLVGGTPADCASLGIFNLFETPPDLVISGPNVGRNSGMAFATSSGTLGGAIVAGLSGVDAIALSVYIPKEIHNFAQRTPSHPLVTERHKDWTRLGEQMVLISEKILDQKLHERSRIINVNVPWSVEESTPFSFTHLGSSRYGRMFERQEDGSFRHDNYEISFDEVTGHYTDEQCLNDEKISVTLIDPLLAGRVLSKEEAEAMTKDFSSY